MVLPQRFLVPGNKQNPKTVVGDLTTSDRSYKVSRYYP